MPKSVKIWRAVRWPLFVFIVVVVLTTVGLVTRDLLVARSVEKTIAEAEKLETLGTVAHLRTAGQTLSNLASKHPDRANAQAAWAWLAVIQAVLHGSGEDLVKNAKEALGLAGGEASSFGWAARAGIKHLEGEDDKALEITTEGLKEHPSDKRIQLARAWALEGLGRSDEARDVLAEATASSSDYVPLFVESVVLEIAVKDKEKASEQVEKLLAISPAHLYGSLVKIFLALPEWGAEDLGDEQIASIVDDIHTISDVLESAPPKLSDFGRVIQGRVYLSAGDLESAGRAFSLAVTKPDPDPKTVAWYALVLRRQNRPDEALRLLDKYPEATGSEILDIRSQSLLDCHRVDTVVESLEALEASGDYPRRLSQMRWILAVRSGDTAAAIASMPDALEADQQCLALELYWQLKEDGDSKSIERLEEAMSSNMAGCADAIRAWHSEDSKQAMGALSPKESSVASCVDVLAIKLLCGYVKPAKLKERADRAKDACGLNLRMEVDRARTAWRTDGYKTAKKILDDILKMKPEASPLKRAMSEVYIAMDLHEQVLQILKGDESPEATALKIQAARAAGNKDIAAGLVKTAIAKNEAKFHPALAYFQLQDFLRAGKFYDVLDNAEPHLSKTGEWTSKIAELAARAYDIKGDRTDADRILYRTSKEVGAAVGMDESWQTLLAQIRLNMRRGGKFMYRSIYLLSVLKDEGVENAETLYNWALANIKDGNDRMGLRYLRQSIELDPTYKPAFAKLAEMGKLDDDIISVLKKTRPGWSPEPPSPVDGR